MTFDRLRKQAPYASLCLSKRARKNPCYIEARSSVDMNQVFDRTISTSHPTPSLQPRSFAPSLK